MPLITEGIDDDQAHQQAEPHGEDQRQPDPESLVSHTVDPPGVLLPCPPQHKEDQRPAEDAGRRWVVTNERHRLSDGKHEDQVEEQLERRHRELRDVVPLGHPADHPSALVGTSSVAMIIAAPAASTTGMILLAALMLGATVVMLGRSAS